MKLLGSLVAALVVLVVGGAIYLASADISVPQTPVTKNIEPAGN